jgi:hypothetical protein
MNIVCYSARILNPFRGVMNIISLGDAEAVTVDGVSWPRYVRDRFDVTEDEPENRGGKTHQDRKLRSHVENGDTATEARIGQPSPRCVQRPSRLENSLSKTPAGAALAANNLCQGMLYTATHSIDQIR